MKKRLLLSIVITGLNTLGAMEVALPLTTYVKVYSSRDSTILPVSIQKNSALLSGTIKHMLDDTEAQEVYLDLDAPTHAVMCRLLSTPEYNLIPELQALNTESLITAFTAANYLDHQVLLKQIYQELKERWYKQLPSLDEYTKIILLPADIHEMLIGALPLEKVLKQVITQIKVRTVFALKTQLTYTGPLDELFDLVIVDACVKAFRQCKDRDIDEEVLKTAAQDFVKVPSLEVLSQSIKEHKQDNKRELKLSLFRNLFAYYAHHVEKEYSVSSDPEYRRSILPVLMEAGIQVEHVAKELLQVNLTQALLLLHLEQVRERGDKLIISKNHHSYKEWQSIASKEVKEFYASSISCASSIDQIFLFNKTTFFSTLITLLLLNAITR